MGKKRWFVVGGCGLLVLGGLAISAKSNDKKQEMALPFRLGRVQMEALQVCVREIGVVEPSRKVEIKSLVSGKVVGMAVREGAHVKAGQLLAEVEPGVEDAKEYSRIRGELQKEQLEYRNAEREFRQSETLFKEGLISQNEYQLAKNKYEIREEFYQMARVNYQIVESRGIPIARRDTRQIARISSPMDGVVIKKGAEIGDTITSGVSSQTGGTVVYQVADLKSLIVKVNLNEVDVGKVRVGQPVLVGLEAYPQRSFDGKVRFLSPGAKLVEKIKVFEVEVELNELPEYIRPTMTASVEILGEKRENAVSVPLEAIQKKNGKVVVYRLKKNMSVSEIQKAREGLAGRSKFIWLSDNWRTYFDPVPVKVGISTLERAELLEGLSPNEQVSLEDPTRKKIEKEED